MQRKKRNISQAQREIYGYISVIFRELDILLNDTKTIKPLHIDIYIPKLKIGLEYDGEYWHYSPFAIKNGSIEKMIHKNNVCKRKRIKLIRIREKHWEQNKEKVLQEIVDFIGGTNG